MELENEEKCTYCREYGNLPCDECEKKLEEKKAMNKYMPFINIPNVEMKSSKSKPMNKTKFTKVAVEDRLPSEQGTYMVIFKDNKVGKFNFWNEEGFKDSWNEHVNFWFEEGTWYIKGCEELEEYFDKNDINFQGDFSTHGYYIENGEWDCNIIEHIQHRTELTYPEFIKLFEGGERKTL